MELKGGCIITIFNITISNCIQKQASVYIVMKLKYGT